MSVCHSASNKKVDVHSGGSSTDKVIAAIPTDVSLETTTTTAVSDENDCVAGTLATPQVESANDSSHESAQEKGIVFVDTTIANQTGKTTTEDNDDLLDILEDADEGEGGSSDTLAAVNTLTNITRAIDLDVIADVGNGDPSVVSPVGQVLAPGISSPMEPAFRGDSPVERMLAFSGMEPTATASEKVGESAGSVESAAIAEGTGPRTTASPSLYDTTKSESLLPKSLPKEYSEDDGDDSDSSEELQFPVSAIPSSDITSCDDIDELQTDECVGEADFSFPEIPFPSDSGGTRGVTHKKRRGRDVLETLIDHDVSGQRSAPDNPINQDALLVESGDKLLFTCRCQEVGTSSTCCLQGCLLLM